MWADLWFFYPLLLVPPVPILSACTLHTLIFALATAPLAAASINFFFCIDPGAAPVCFIATTHKPGKYRLEPVVVVCFCPV